MKRVPLLGTILLILALPMTVLSAKDMTGKTSDLTHTALSAAKQVNTPASVLTAQLSMDASKEIMLLTGRVVQTMNSGGYTYVYLENKGEKKWVATPEMHVKLGEELTFKGGSEMLNFSSKSLKRKFEKIFFCGPPLPRAGAAIGVMPGNKSHGDKAAVVLVKTTKVEKASGSNAYTIADLYNKKASLDKKKIVVRGKVIKVSARIMDRNWIHMQDGTGEAKKRTNKLVITSSDLPAVGDIMTASGVLAKDRDFGSGYLYDLILEQATIMIEK